MKRNLVLAVCGASLAFFLSPAYSADGPYLSANIGAAMLSDSDVTDAEAPGGEAELSYDNGWALGAALGYRLGNFRVEGEVSYQKNDLDEIEILGAGLEASGDASGVAFLVNGYYDFTNTTAFTPFVSAGLGYARVELNDFNYAGSGDPDFSEDDSVFAYQVGFGVGYGVSENVTIDLRYRYFATADPEFDTAEVEIASHNILLGVRYSF